eukprot:TRINITY_DN16110_c0_g2_i1.p1 TRINITY_DN16110_c0_g2~~TRINITY_DN16110_c0_g2_i1.p1  ORF type:complete len:100 (-),score=7.94 TRINITY_DN16110_c0_g2_i1:160-459(-)
MPSLTELQASSNKMPYATHHLQRVQAVPTTSYCPSLNISQPAPAVDAACAVSAWIPLVTCSSIPSLMVLQNLYFTIQLLSKHISTISLEINEFLEASLH